jgi:AcrR family transcriptional regulator
MKTGNLKSESVAKSPGRPRNAATNARLTAVTLELLATSGYQQLSMEAVARAAGTTKASIYLRYPHKLALVMDAIGSALQISTTPDTGDTCKDLEILLQQTVAFQSGPYGAAFFGALLAEEARRPQDVQRYRERILIPRAQLYDQVLRRGISRGDVRADIDVPLVYELLAGRWYAYHLLGRPVDERYMSETVGFVWAAIAT